MFQVHWWKKAVMIALTGMISSSTRHHAAMIACKSKAGRLDVSDDST
jgi:hypothetical protein